MIYPVTLDGGKGGGCPQPPISPKADRRLQMSKSHDSLCPLSSGGSSPDRPSCHRDVHSVSDGECDIELVDTRSAEKQSLFRDLCQTQLSLWTFTVSTLLTYFWQKRVNVRSVVFAGCALTVSIFMSGLLMAVVMAAHLFNSDFAGSFGGFGEWMNDEDKKYFNLIRRQSSSFRKNSRRSSGGSGATTPKGGDKFQQTRLWQKNVATLDRSYAYASSRS